MKKNNRILAFFLTCFLWIYICPFSTLSAPLESDMNTIYIDTVEDLIELSNNCSLDTYSQNKTVKLRNNLSFSDYDFVSIPTFGGTFDGCGYTIKDLTINTTGSDLGLFRYVQETGVIKNLEVIGTIIPNGSENKIGGITGVNRGRIQNCKFTGVVSGKSNIGGITGINETNGYITGCTISGNITGESFTGGVAGQNLGIINQCTNKSYINTSSSDLTLKLDQLKLDQPEWNHLPLSHDVITQTDIGGIAGFSTGLLQSCENQGTIGYQHIGYNVGGIVGRQSGYTNSCRNYGEILGRKDVSGIVGQMEPYMLLQFSEDSIQKIEGEFDTLKSLLDKSVTDANASSQIISDRLSSVINQTDKATNELQELSTKTTNYVDESTEIINTTRIRLKTMLDRSVPIIDSLGDSGEDMTVAFTQFEKAFRELKISSDNVSDGFKKMEDAFGDLEKAIPAIESAFKKMSNAMERLQTVIDEEDTEEIKKAIKELNESIEELQDAMNQATETVIAIAKILSQADNTDDIDWVSIGKELTVSAISISKNLNSAFDKMQNALAPLPDAIDEDVKIINESLAILQDAFKDLETATGYIKDSTSKFKEAMSEFSTASASASKAMERLEAAMFSLSNASSDMTYALRELEKVVEDASKDPIKEFPILGDRITEASNNLFATLKNISNELKKLNTETNGISNKLSQDILAINNQFSVVIKTILTGRENAEKESSDFYEDISDDDYTEDSSKSHEGYVSQCVNQGSITGDINVGGIAGSIAIDYDFDPEDDVKKNGDSSLNFKYLTKAILKDSINNGHVTGKKNYVGGLAGRMDLGSISQCENYGSIESANGDYVGGITGSSNTIIRNSYSKCMLSGKNFVGGITGHGMDVSGCYSLVQIENATENIGAIAGIAKGEFTDNFFVKDKWAGIDGISYSGKATPLAYDTFIQQEGLPDEFQYFTLTFKVNDTVIKNIPFKYGDSISQEDLPKIPKKKGYYSSWPEFNYNRLTFSQSFEAMYTPLITVLSSEKSDTSEKPKLLVEGNFGPDTFLKIDNCNIASSISIEKRNISEQWIATIVDDKRTFEGPFTFRYLVPDTKNKLTIYQLDHGKWQRVNPTRDGSYLVFTSNDPSITFCVVETSIIKLYITYLIIGIIVLLAIFLLIRFIRKNKNKILAYPKFNIRK